MYGYKLVTLDGSWFLKVTNPFYLKYQTGETVTASIGGCLIFESPEAAYEFIRPDVTNWIERILLVTYSEEDVIPLSKQAAIHPTERYIRQAWAGTLPEGSGRNWPEGTIAVKKLKVLS